MNETWKPVLGAAFYEVSDQGRVRSLDRVVAGRDGKDSRRKGKVLTGTIASNGYPMVTIMNDAGKRRNRTIHSLVAETFLGTREAGVDVLHGNGDRTDAALSNLRYGTAKQNYQDSVAHGTSLRPAHKSCRRGHELIPGNLYLSEIAGRGQRRQCRECALLTSKEAQRVSRGFYINNPDAPHYV